jgi:cephalosporin-C deacetylase
VDYEKLGKWIGAALRGEAKKQDVELSKILETMSYFDIKNFAGKIKCPIVMGVGLQDIVCPPHTNFSGYNLITSPKEYYIYPKNGHSLPIKEWFKVRENFFDKFL